MYGITSLDNTEAESESRPRLFINKTSVYVEGLSTFTGRTKQPRKSYGRLPTSHEEGNAT